MNVIRTLPFLVLALALTACAGKPAREAAPASVAVDASTPVEDAPAATVPPVDDGAAAPAAAVATDGTAAPVAQAAGESAPTDAEDDFAALYGGPAPGATGSEPGRPAYDPWEPFNRRCTASTTWSTVPSPARWPLPTPTWCRASRVPG